MRGPANLLGLVVIPSRTTLRDTHITNFLTYRKCVQWWLVLLTRKTHHFHSPYKIPTKLASAIFLTLTT